MTRTRRDFLKASLGASALWPLASGMPALLARAATAAAEKPAPDGTVLVVVELAGGNDSLNTVVPYADDAYHKARPTLRAVAEGVHKIDDHLGFHPRMAAMARLLGDGHLSIVQGVGYPKSSRDHNGAKRAWHSALPERPDCQTGWLGRAVDLADEPDRYVVPGVFVGAGGRPFVLSAEQSFVPTVPTLRQSTLIVPAAWPGGDAHRRRLAELAGLPRAEGGALLDYARRSTSAAYAVARKIDRVAGGDAGAAGYPDFPLAANLRTVAQLVRAELGIRIYYADLAGGGIGGFDNHANQLGNHGALLYQLSESVAAFADDLARDRLLGRVLLMTFSEFGRTVHENGRRGTDHGAAASMLLAGGSLKGGLIGRHPSLTDLDADAQKHHTDFRQLYATALDRWLGLDSRAVLGDAFEPVDVVSV